MDPWSIAIPGTAALVGSIVGYGAANSRSQIFGPTIFCTPLPNNLAITFDDGPNPAATPKLLDLLNRYQAKATFFVIGKFVRECTELTREIASRGHLIGNHTHTHPNLFWRGPETVRTELHSCQEAIFDATGQRAEFFRPPYGFRNPWVVAIAHACGMRTVMWTLIPGDWKSKSAEWLSGRMRPIAAHARASTSRPNGDVLCLHDGAHRALGGDRSHTLAALEYWLPRWRDLGLKFVTISEAAQTAAR